MALALLSVTPAFGKTIYVGQSPQMGKSAAPLQSRNNDLNDGLFGAYTAAAAEKPQVQPQFDIDEFKTFYDKVSQPNIAILLNRTLSDSYTDWDTKIRTVGLAQANVKRTDSYANEPEKNSERAWNVDSKGVAYVQEKTPADQVRETDEPWMWVFKDGFFKPFLESQTRLVDRNTIIRLTAEELKKAGNTYEDLDSRTIETQALQKYSDIFIEILVGASSDIPGTDQIQITAKETKTGRILASVNSQYPGGLGDIATPISLTKPRTISSEEKTFTLGSQMAHELMKQMMLSF